MDLYAAQRWIYTSFTGQLTEFAHTRSWGALALVLPLGIVFGAVHALTPGHGKSVRASYLVGSRLAVLRSLAVAGALALTHVGSAVVLALLAAPLITRTLGGGGRAPLLEMLSWGLLAAVGAWLLLRAMRDRPHLHHEGVMVGVMAGLIPCPLTLFVMLYALARGVAAAGLAFALAMLGGIAITLAAVALATVLAREGVLRILTRHGGSIERLSRTLDALSGALLLLIGVGELWRLAPN
jgi:ABC-type nickel/cobalt efflux system permease component RcnA